VETVSDLNTEFPVVRRGYDMDEVDAFMSRLDTVMDAKLLSASARIEALEAELAEAKRHEEAVHLTLVAATKTKDELLVDAQRELTEATGNAREQAERILSEAKREAFRLVTEANRDAEQIIGSAMARGETEAAGGSEAVRATAVAAAEAEAEQIRAAARADAENEIAAARTEALQMIAELKDESQRLVAARESELQGLQIEFDTEQRLLTERIARLRGIGETLEIKVRGALGGALEQIESLNTPFTSSVTSTSVSNAEAMAMAMPEPEHVEAAPPATPNPEMGAPVETLDEVVAVDVAAVDAEEEPDPSRGSFYSRRSAKLPRIGAEAANGALAAVSAMRASHRDREGARAKDVAMQTA
jgi:DivIVA domain-containing protein